MSTIGDMARLADVPVVLRTVGAWPFLKRIVREVLDDNLFTLAGGLAYSWLFALFPYLVFLMNLFPFFAIGHEAATKDGMRVFLFAALPDPAADMLWNHMKGRIDAIIADRSAPIAVLSLLVALWAASKGIGVTMAAMERCYELEKGRAFYTRRPMAFGLTVTVSLLVFVLVLLLPAGAAFKSWTVGQAESVSYWGLWAFDIVRGSLAVGVVVLILALFYHFGPSVKHRWNFITPGSLFVLISWVLVALAFRYYVNHFGKSKYEETFGSVGGAAVLLLLFYIDALVLLIGAEINSEIDFEVLKVPRGTRNFRIAERRAGLNGDAAEEGDWYHDDLDGQRPGRMTCSHGAD
jgi:membrane protein